jgi:L-iditol 2-dehydrogenase
VCETLRRTNFDPGGFAEYVRLPAINVERGTYLIPEGVSWVDASFAEPLACVLRAQRMARVQPGDTVLVIGSGMAGLLYIQLACALGATRVVAVDVNHDRLKVAARLGADTVVSADEDILSQIRRANDGRLADKVFVCTGARPANARALESVERGGIVLFFAPTEPGVIIPLSINDVFFGNDVTLMTSYAGSPADHVTALELIRAGRMRVAELVSHRLPLSQTARGFQLVSAAEKSIKVVIEPQR